MIKEQLPDYIVSFADKAFLVGGAVRDLISGRTPMDFDLVVRNRPERMAASMATATGGHYFVLGKSKSAVHRVVFAGGTIDISILRAGDIRSDLLLRDFTVNAMAFDLNRNELLDPANGMKDLLTLKCIRLVSANGLLDDPLRIIRAHRLAATLGLVIDNQTRQRISEQVPLLDKVAGERIWTELRRLLEFPDSATQINWMMMLGVLDTIFKINNQSAFGLDKLKNPVKQTNRWTHTISVYRRIEELFINGDNQLPIEAASFFAHLPENDKVRIKMAILLHDRLISCPFYNPVKDIENDSLPPESNVQLRVAEICKRLRTSTADQRWIAFVLGHWSYPISMLSASKPHSLGWFFIACKEFSPIILLGAYAELKAIKKASTVHFEKKKKRIEFLLNYYFTFISQQLGLMPKINGNDIQRLFGLPPSPLIGETIVCLTEAFLEGRISNKDDAFKLAEAFLKNTAGRLPPKKP